ncbi:LCP family protein [Spongisporangium articulatum]|uniref:LCP family protein n=1 Tax=Spongisporangium articulatum TaxID=3362603 RepID=A0ABW8AIG1_9ACTN
MTQVESYSSRRERRAADSAQAPEEPADYPTTTTRPTRRSGGGGGGGGGGLPGVRSIPGILRGRHATPWGQGFAYVVGWTIVSYLFPGAGLAAAGWRKFGRFLLLLQALAIAIGVGLALQGTALLDQVVAVGVSPNKLLALLGVFVFGALLWGLFILMTSAGLRRSAVLTRSQKSFSSLLVVALLVGIALPVYWSGERVFAQRDLINTLFPSSGGGTKPNNQKADPWAGIPRMNVLLIGSDAGADRTGVRTDTLILASIDTKSGYTILYSLPRNLGHAQFKPGSPGARKYPNGFTCGASVTTDTCMINAVWTWASGPDGKQYYTGKTPGLQATEDVVSGTLGLKIDNYALLSIQGLVDFVNAIGGVKVNVTQRLPRGGHPDATPAMGAYYTEATQGYLEPGNRKLNGFDAMWYARSRRTTDDYDRMRRQRCLIGDLVEQSDPITLAQHFPDIAKAIKKNSATNISQDSLEAWVDLAQRIQKGGKTYSLAFTNKVLSSGTWNPDYTEIHRLVKKAIAKSDKDYAKAQADKAAAAASPSAGTTPTPTKTKKPTGTGVNADDSSSAQDIKQLCG